MIGSKCLTGTPIPQDYLESAISWASGGQVEQHMSAHQHDANASVLWSHFQAAIQWVERTFTTYRKELKGWQDKRRQLSDALRGRQPQQRRKVASRASPALLRDAMQP
ncbi:MAG: hypothetical protein ACKVHU_21635 [Acidimicrobiales bacterium]|jgi:hypothetical protein